MKSTELNAAMALLSIALIVAVPQINIGAIGLDFTQFNQATILFTRLGLLLITAHFLRKAIQDGDKNG